jgi:hypothetical protein
MSWLPWTTNLLFMLPCTAEMTDTYHRAQLYLLKWGLKPQFLISAFLVARITGMCYHTWQDFLFFFFIFLLLFI